MDLLNGSPKILLNALETIGVIGRGMTSLEKKKIIKSNGKCKIGFHKEKYCIFI